MPTLMLQRAGLVLMVVLLLPAIPAVAQQQEVSLAELRERLAQLDKAIEEQTAANQARQAANQEALDQERQRQKQLAQDLLEADLQRHRLLDEKSQLADQYQQLRPDHESVGPALRAAFAASRSGGEQLQIYLSEIPGHEASLASVERLLQSIRSASVEAPPDQAAGAAGLMAIAESTLQEAAAIQLVEREIWTAENRRERADLLSVGHTAFAYRTVEGGRLGIALSSPAEASGYRWVEQLSGQVRRDLAAAFEAVAQGRANDAAVTVAMPMDVSGRMQPTSMAGHATLMDRLREGGLVMAPLGAVALLALLLVLERAWVLYGRNSNAGALADRVVEACQRRDFEEALRLCESRPGAVVHTLAACLRRRTKGQAAMEDSVQAQLLSELPRLQRFMGGIAILAAVAPLLGLLGTVTGIIQTFGVIRAFGNANPSLMAGGISEALLTTAAGLIIAVPILLLHGLLSGRVDRIVGNAEKHAANLLAVLAHDVAEKESAADPDDQPSEEEVSARG